MNRLLFICLCIFSQTAGIQAQSINYSIDPNAFLGLSIEGGNTQTRLVDIDLDGHLDLVSIGDHGSPNIGTNEHGVSVFFGDGTGTNFMISQSGGFGYGGCAVGDINNDGKQDIAYSMHHVSNKLIEAALGNGSGTSWTLWDGGLATHGETYGMFGTDLADIDNDGWLDIASNSFGSGSGVHIYRNDHTGNWTQKYSFGVGGNTGKYVQYGDMDGDGNMDFVVSNEDGAALFGNGTGSFLNKDNGLPVPPSTWYYEDVSLGDIDNDGDDDMVFAFNNLNSGGTRGVYVYKWNKGTQQWDNASNGLPTSTSELFYIARMCDMDMDGYLDLITVNNGTKNLEIWKGNGGTSWSLYASVSMPAMYYGQVSDIAFGDVDHSGFPDIAIWSSFNVGNKLQLIRDNRMPQAINATVTYPKGGECWPNSAVRFINWVSAIPSNHPSTVMIEYSSTGSSGPWTMIAASAPNNGIYQWNVPATVVSNNCYIRVTAKDNNTSATAFSMNANPFSMGCTTSTTGITQVKNDNTLSVYPNPMGASTTINTELTNCSINIIDVNGKVVRDYSNVNQFPFTIERGDLAQGIYMLELRSGSKTERKKMVVN